MRILTGCEKEACRLVWSVLSRPLIAEDKVFLIAAMAHWPQQNWMEPILNEHLEQLLGYEPGFPKAMQALAKFFVNKEIPSTLKSYFPQLFSSETQRSAAPAAEGGSGNHSAGFWGDGAAAATAARVNAVESYDFDDSDDEARICSF